MIDIGGSLTHTCLVWSFCEGLLCSSPLLLLSSQALGCILYLLCFKQHPFEDGAKLQIVNGKYSIPQNDTKYTVYHDLIRTFTFKSQI